MTQLEYRVGGSVMNAEEKPEDEKGSIGHKIEMAVVRETLRKAPSFTLYGDCDDCHKGECTMNCSSATFEWPYT